MCILTGARSAFVGHFILTSWRYAPTVMKAIGRLLVLSLVVAAISAAVFPQCDFDDDACDYAGIVADVQNGPGVLADKITPDREKAREKLGDDTAGAPPSGDSWAAVWPTSLPGPDMPDRSPRPVWYPRWTTLQLASSAADTPDLPPRI